MERVRVELSQHFSFTARIPVRITDVNYGGHVGNDTILSIMQEARMQYLKHFGYTELDFAGVGMIMSDVTIEFKNELFYGDTVNASVAAGEFSKVSFNLYYNLEKETKDGKHTPVAFAKTGMVCFDYNKKKISSVPGEAKTRLLKND